MSHPIHSAPHVVLCGGGGEVRATAHCGSGGSVTWGATWAWEDLEGGGGGDTAAIHFDPHYLAWEGGDSIDSHYQGLGKALGKSWKPDAVKALKTLSGFTPGARTIHLLDS